MSDELIVPSPVPTDAAPAESGLGRRNDRLLLASIGAYVLILSGLMIVRGVSVTPDVLLVAFGLAAVILGRARLFIRDWIPFIGLFLAYELMRGYADNFGQGVHVADVLGLERWLFGGHLPTQVLQDAFHPATGTDVLAMVGTVFYFLHFPLPIAVAFLLWLRRRRVYYDYVAALILLSMAGFLTYLLLPVAPPWYAAQAGFIPGANGLPAITYLKQQGFNDLARLFGFEGNYLYSYAVYDINPNQVAAFPSLHAGYPTLAFLFARRYFGHIGWLMLGYAVCVWFSIVYLADHYVVDILGGVAYAAAAYWIIVHAPGWFRRFVDAAADPELEAAAEAAPGLGAGDAGPRRWSPRIARGIRWQIVRQGLVLAAVGALGVVFLAKGAVLFGAVPGPVLGGNDTPLFLVPWFVLLGGLWRSALGLLSR
ncbi:MAG TPA: phosphatase PAP2 family protein [Candidatus Limnocylindrales bacterium]|jgi:hypothetical protein